MIRKVMFDECNDAGAGYVGQTVLPKRKKEKDPNMPNGLVETISMFYTHLITSCVEAKYNRVYSPFENGFYDLKPMEPSIQDFTTPNELQVNFLLLLYLGSFYFLNFCTILKSCKKLH